MVPSVRLEPCGGIWGLRPWRSGFTGVHEYSRRGGEMVKVHGLGAFFSRAASGQFRLAVGYQGQADARQLVRPRNQLTGRWGASREPGWPGRSSADGFAVWAEGADVALPGAAV